MTNETQLLQKKRKNSKLRRLIALVTFIVALASMMALSTFADEAYPVVALEGGSSMTGLIEDIFDSFSTVIKGLAQGLKDAFGHIIYVDPAATSPTFSPMIVFLFTMAGVGLATGILYKIFGMVRANKRGG